MLPDFPWDALAPYGARARESAGGIIDLSQGTPVDATPEFIQSALKDSSNAPISSMKRSAYNVHPSS